MVMPRPAGGMRERGIGSAGLRGKAGGAPGSVRACLAGGLLGGEGGEQAARQGAARGQAGKTSSCSARSRSISRPAGISTSS